MIVLSFYVGLESQLNKGGRYPSSSNQLSPQDSYFELVSLYDLEKNHHEFFKNGLTGPFMDSLKKLTVLSEFSSQEGALIAEYTMGLEKLLKEGPGKSFEVGQSLYYQLSENYSAHKYWLMQFLNDLDVSVERKIRFLEIEVLRVKKSSSFQKNPLSLKLSSLAMRLIRKSGHRNSLMILKKGLLKKRPEKVKRMLIREYSGKDQKVYLSLLKATKLAWRKK